MELSAIGIDVSKDTLDVSIFTGGKPLGKQFANTEAGHAALINWLKHRKLGQVHACMEATGRYSLGVALALHAAGHVVSIVNPAQIHDFARTKLGRNKSDTVDAGQIREYGAMFRPAPWQPPTPALRLLCDLQTMRAGFVASKVEWENRAGSVGGDAAANALLSAAYRALPAKGVLLVAEPMMGTEATAPVGGAYFGFYLLAMGQGRARAPQELRHMLSTAGFAATQVVRTRQPLQTGLIVARKDA